MMIPASKADSRKTIKNRPRNSSLFSVFPGISLSDFHLFLSMTNTLQNLSFVYDDPLRQWLSGFSLQQNPNSVEAALILSDRRANVVSVEWWLHYIVIYIYIQINYFPLKIFENEKKLFSRVHMFNTLAATAIFAFLLCWTQAFI